VALTAEEFIARKEAQWAAVRDAFKDTEREGRVGWMRKAWTFHVQSNYQFKVISIERWELVDGVLEETHHFRWGAEFGDTEYRFGYWVLPGDGVAADTTWRWGEYSLLVPGADLWPLIARARANGTIRPQDFDMSVTAE